MWSWERDCKELAGEAATIWSCSPSYGSCQGWAFWRGADSELGDVLHRQTEDHFVQKARPCCRSQTYFFIKLLICLTFSFHYKKPWSATDTCNLDDESCSPLRCCNKYMTLKNIFFFSHTEGTVEKVSITSLVGSCVPSTKLVPDLCGGLWMFCYAFPCHCGSSPLLACWKLSAMLNKGNPARGSCFARFKLVWWSLLLGRSPGSLSKQLLPWVCRMSAAWSWTKPDYDKIRILRFV